MPSCCVIIFNGGKEVQASIRVASSVESDPCVSHATLCVLFGWLFLSVLRQ